MIGSLLIILFSFFTMELLQLNIEESGWFVLLCLAIAALYSFFLYPKKGDWSTAIHYTLVALRFTAVFLIAFLFLSPFFNSIKNHFEKPIITIVVDDSHSIQLEQKASYPDSIKTKLNIVDLFSQLLGVLFPGTPITLEFGATEWTIID